MNDDGRAFLARSAARSTELILDFENVLAQIDLTPAEEGQWLEWIECHRQAIGDIEGMLTTEDLREARARASREGNRAHLHIFDAELHRRGLS